MTAADPRISPPGGLSIFLIFALGHMRRGGGASKIFLEVGHIPDEIFLLINYFLDATHRRNRIFLSGKQIFAN